MDYRCHAGLLWTTQFPKGDCSAFFCWYHCQHMSQFLRSYGTIDACLVTYSCCFVYCSDIMCAWLGMCKLGYRGKIHHREDLTCCWSWLSFADLDSIYYAGCTLWCRCFDHVLCKSSRTLKQQGLIKGTIIGGYERGTWMVWSTTWPCIGSCIIGFKHWFLYHAIDHDVA